MAHNLNIDANGRAAFASFRKSAWHGLGRVIDAEMNDADILREALLDWQVQEQPIFAGSTQAIGTESLTTYRDIAGHKLLTRSDTGQDLAVVSAGFRVFQNAEMVSLMRQIGGDSLVWETAGALGTNGATTWAMARLPDLAISLGKDDKTDMYLLLTNGHGNSRALVVMPTTVRVVCANTMRAADGDKNTQKQRIANAEKRDFTASALASGYGIHHNEGLDRAVADVEQAYRRCLANKDATKVAYDMMAAKAISDADARLYWESIFALPASQDETERTVAMREEREAKRRRSLSTIWSSPTSKTEAANGTVFGAFQAAVEYLDHEAPARSPGSRAFRAVMGSDVAVKRIAWDAALELAATA